MKDGKVPLGVSQSSDHQGLFSYTVFLGLVSQIPRMPNEILISISQFYSFFHDSNPNFRSHEHITHTFLEGWIILGVKGPPVPQFSPPLSLQWNLLASLRSIPHIRTEAFITPTVGNGGNWMFSTQQFSQIKPPSPRTACIPAPELPLRRGLGFKSKTGKLLPLPSPALCTPCQQVLLSSMLLSSLGAREHPSQSLIHQYPSMHPFKRCCSHHSSINEPTPPHTHTFSNLFKSQRSRSFGK